MTDEEMAQRKARREQYLASLALEGEYLTAEQLAMFERFDSERLTDEERLAEIMKRYPVTTRPEP